MQELEIIDNNSRSILTKRKGYKLFAFIDAINMSSNKKILVRNFTTTELISIFNNYLKKNYGFELRVEKQLTKNSIQIHTKLKGDKDSFKKINRPTKNEKNQGSGKGYLQTLKEAKDLIKKI